MSVCPSCHSSYEATVRVCPKDGTPLPIEPTPDANIGQLLEGKYRIDAFISSGGMGSVYRATHVMLDKIVAIKLIRKELVKTAEAATRFQREARAASTLEHPNIAAVFDFGQTADGTLYIAMEYVEGPSLKEVIQKDGPMEPAKIVAVLGPVAGALARAHRHHIIHRDLKPHNILLATDKDGRQVPKLLDFGIAKTVDEPAGGLTLTGYALGTPQYMSPEQAMGKAVDGRSDVYSLGVVLYEMLIGDVPFADTSVAGVLLKQMTAAPDAPSRRRPDVHISPALEAIALRCLEKEPDHRFQSAGEFIAALSQADAVEAAGVAAPSGPTSAMSVTPGNPETPGDPGKTGSGGKPGDSEKTVPNVSLPVEDAATLTTSPAAAHATAPQALPEPTTAPISPRETPDRLSGEPIAPQPVTTASAASVEPSVRFVKPGTQPTVVVPAASPDMAPPVSRQSAAPGAVFWVAVAVIVLVAVGSGAWVIRTWAPPFTPTNQSAQAPTATPAMAQLAPPVEIEKEKPDRALQTQTQEIVPSPPPDSAPVPGAAPATATPAVETPPVSAAVRPAVPSTPKPAPAASSSRPASASAPASLPASSAGADSVQRQPQATAPSGDVLAQTVPDTGAASQSARERIDPPVAPTRIENPTVFVRCNGPSEICSPVRSAMADALRRDHMQLTAGRSRADVTLAVDVELVEQRIEKSFGTTFAPRTYSVDVAGESQGLVVSMPPARTFSFDARVGRERANENARLLAADAVDRVRDFWNKRP